MEPRTKKHLLLGVSIFLGIVVLTLSIALPVGLKNRNKKKDTDGNDRNVTNSPSQTTGSGVTVGSQTSEIPATTSSTTTTSTTSTTTLASTTSTTTLASTTSTTTLASTTSTTTLASTTTTITTTTTSLDLVPTVPGEFEASTMSPEMVTEEIGMTTEPTASMTDAVDLPNHTAATPSGSTSPAPSQDCHEV